MSDDVAGTWNIDMKAPMGKESGVLDLKVDGRDLSGTMQNKQGSVDFSGGTVDGSRLSFDAQVTSPVRMTMKWNGVVDGDAISGTIKLGMFGKASFKGVRAS